MVKEYIIKSLINGYYWNNLKYLSKKRSKQRLKQAYNMRQKEKNEIGNRNSDSHIKCKWTK